MIAFSKFATEVLACILLLPIIALFHTNIYAGTDVKNISIPQQLLGTWDVVKVGVDARDQPHWYYQKDDSRLLGRELVISEQSLKFNDGSHDCVKPQWTSKTTTWEDLLRERFKRPPSQSIPVIPTSHDFGLKVSAKQSFDLFQINCEKIKKNGIPSPWNETWFVYDGRDLMMGISTTAILVINKRQPLAKPNPSFSCTKAQSQTEKALCNSISLAALDRSVAAAWRVALPRKPELSSKLREEQTTWLTARDTCGQDAACLQNKMLLRIDELIQE